MNTLRQALQVLWSFIKDWWVFVFPLLTVASGLTIASIYSKRLESFHNLIKSELAVREASHWGQFGDFFGGLMNPLISLFILFVAVLVWKLQKNELRETREALHLQAETNELQRFENTLFKLIEHCHKSVEHYSVKRSATDVFKPRIKSLEAIRYLIEQLEVTQEFEGRLMPESIKALVNECDAYGFNQIYAPSRYAYRFALRTCPDTSKSSDYATMTFMLLGEEIMKLCRFWAIAVEDKEFLDSLPEDSSNK